MRSGAPVFKLWPQVKAGPLRGYTNVPEIRLEKWGSQAEVHLLGNCGVTVSAVGLLEQSHVRQYP